jgi:hypothetical protein
MGRAVRFLADMYLLPFHVARIMIRPLGSQDRTALAACYLVCSMQVWLWWTLVRAINGPPTYLGGANKFALLLAGIALCGLLPFFFVLHRGAGLRFSDRWAILPRNYRALVGVVVVIIIAGAIAIENAT